MNPDNVTPNAAEILAHAGLTAEELVAMARERLANVSARERSFGRVDFEIGDQRLAVQMNPKGDGSDAKVFAEIDGLRDSVRLADALEAKLREHGREPRQDDAMDKRRAYLRMMDEDEGVED